MSLSLVRKCPSDNHSVWNHITAWCHIGIKPYFEAVLTVIYVAYDFKGPLTFIWYSIHFVFLGADSSQNHLTKRICCKIWSWETMVKSYHNMLTDWFFSCFIHRNMNLSVLNRQFVAHFMVAMKITLLLWTGCQVTQMNNCHENLNTCLLD